MARNGDDQQWLDVLSGKGPHGDPQNKAQLEAELVRKAVLRNAQSSERTFETSEAGFRRLVEEARKRRLLRGESRSWRPMLVLQSVYGLLARPASIAASIAIILGLGIVVSVQSPQLTSRSELLRSESDPNAPEEKFLRRLDSIIVLRGGTPAERVPQIVDDPTAVAREWQSLLLQAEVEHQVSFEKSGRILIRFRLTPEAQDLMRSHRIEPPSGEWATLVFVPTTAH